MITINIPVEKEYFITPQQTYDIISAAIEDAYDNGFINKYVFYRAMLSHLYVTLEDLDETNAAEEHMNVHISPLGYWYEHIDVISDMIDKYQKEMNYLEETTSQWIQDYIEFAYSTRGMIDNLSDLMEDMTQRAEDDLLSIKAQDQLKTAMEIADKWGMNNDVEVDIQDETIESTIIPVDSLLES